MVTSAAGPGVLVLAATPIGDPRDAAPRLARGARHRRRRGGRGHPAAAAGSAPRLGISPGGSVLSYHEHNEAARTADLLERLVAGDRVVVVTDAGMPSVSDPGYRLVAAAIEAGVQVTCVPGPSAVLTALAVSGLPVDRFCFEGFLPRKAGERLRALQALAGERRTMVFFEAPHRLDAHPGRDGHAFGADRPAAVCRELTKTYEEVRRGACALAAWAAEGVRGEITIVVGGAPEVGGRPGLRAAHRPGAGRRGRAAQGRDGRRRRGHRAQPQGAVQRGAGRAKALSPGAGHARAVTQHHRVGADA